MANQRCESLIVCINLLANTLFINDIKRRKIICGTGYWDSQNGFLSFFTIPFGFIMLFEQRFYMRVIKFQAGLGPFNAIAFLQFTVKQIDVPRKYFAN